MAGGDSEASDRAAAGPAIAAGREGAPLSHAPCEDSASQDPYEPTSPSYLMMRTTEAILATKAASNKRLRIGESFLEGFFEPGHRRTAEDSDLEGLAHHGQAGEDLTPQTNDDLEAMPDAASEGGSEQVVAEGASPPGDPAAESPLAAQPLPLLPSSGRSTPVEQRAAPAVHALREDSSDQWDATGPPPEPDGWPSDVDLSRLEDDFDTKCIIMPGSQRMSGQVEGDRTTGELQVERPVSPEATCAGTNEAAEGVPSDIAEEEGGPGTNSHASRRVRAPSSESDSGSSTSCDSAPFSITMGAQRLRELGYPVFSVDLSYDQKKRKKDVRWPPKWQTTTLDSGTVRDYHNGLAINTTTCDLLGWDVDVQDDGMKSWETLQDAHGPVDAPSVRTTSGGVHLYFSHEKSIAAGLAEGTPTSFSKLYLDLGDGKISRVGIDMRGKGKASCLIAPSSGYFMPSGERVGYEMIQGSELPPIAELPPLPSWIISILDSQASLKERFEQQERESWGKRAVGGSTGARGSIPPSPVPASSEPDLASPELQKEVVSALETLLSTWGDNTSVFSAAKPSSTGLGVIYDFRNGPGGRVACPYFAAQCGGVHDSNNFALMRRGAEVLYLCYGESCKTTSRSRAIRLGMLPLPVAAAFGDSQPLNSERNHLYSDRKLLSMSFLRENLSVMKGDVGCAIILERLYFRTGLKFAFTPSGSYYWTGRCWGKDESGGRILRVLREELSKIQSAYMLDSRKVGESSVESADVSDGLESVGAGDREDGEEGDTDSGAESTGGGQTGGKEEKLVNVNFNAKMSNVVSTCKEYFFQADFQALLDVQKDFRAVANGVVDLRSGHLLPHHPRFMNSRVIDWPFPRYGISYSRGEMVRFLEDIMHLSGEDGPAALEHLQVLLGYGLTGHTSNQVLAIFVGEGSAGKSLLLSVLRKLLGAAYRDVRKEIVVNAKGQRAANKGAASPLEAGLAGALLAVVEETDKSDTLDEAGMKKLTGSDIITARPLFKDFITFTATVLLILCTNYLPKTDKTWSVALRRRLQLACFVKRYFSPHEKGYDPSNALHGAVDTQLLAKLSTMENMQELLAWLVAGAVKWYENGQQLSPMPKRSEDALREYEESNDDFEKFVLNSCIVGDDLFISTKDALDVYNNLERKVDGNFVMNVTGLNSKTLKAVMNNHGFKGPGKPSDLGLGVKYSGSQERGYRGLTLKPPGESLGEMY